MKDLIKLAIPVFIVCILLEWQLSKRSGHRWFNRSDSFANISCGILSQIIGFFHRAFSVFAYWWIFSHSQSFHFIESPLLIWLIGFIGVDFCYYWYHRISHETNFFWSFHVVHHQSEQYNLSVAVRQTGFGGLVLWIFYLPLALIGIPLEVWLTCYAINLIYQFFIHTRYTKSFGFLDYVFNTPSHHRVHHGRNVQYLDRNYAGVFVVWDFLFRSFEPEVEEVDYGTVVPFRSSNPVWANVAPLVDLFKKVKSKKSLKVLFASPSDDLL